MRSGHPISRLLSSRRSYSQQRTKFNSHAVVVDASGRFWSTQQARELQILGEKCDSALEARHLLTLRARLVSGAIEDLRHPHKFVLSVGGHKIGEVWIDFSFVDRTTGRRVLHDCKGRSNRSRDVEYRFFLWKCRHLLAEHGFTVIEIHDEGRSSRSAWTDHLTQRGIR